MVSVPANVFHLWLFTSSVYVLIFSLLEYFVSLFVFRIYLLVISLVGSYNYFYFV